MEIGVIKFGGSSLGSPQARSRVVQILKSLCTDRKVIAVVSAMGRYPAPYATDTLMSLAEGLTARQQDQLISVGELISTLKMHSLCRHCGICSAPLNTRQLGIITDDHYGQAQVLEVRTETLRQTLRQADCVIVPGFQGMTKDQEITTLGRGGSDYTAMLIAAALNVKEVRIITDVDGIYDRDPKQDPQAQRFDRIDYDRLLELIDQGAQVMQRQSIEYARQHQLRVWVGSLMNPGKGTWIGA